MKCPACAARATVLETRERRAHITRRHLCPACQLKFTTKEIMFYPKPRAPGRTAEQMVQVRAAIRARGKHE